jgi:uncharacterized protein
MHGGGLGRARRRLRGWLGERRPVAGAAAEPPRFHAAAEAEARFLRMCALQRMTPGELRSALAGDAAQAAPWVEAAAMFGVASAQLRWAQMLLGGVGAHKDPPAAFRWFAQAAGQGDAEAMNMAGRCCENGWGVAQDLAEAARWYRRSADAGHDWGEYNYANLLFDGRGVAQDRAEAARWYQLAADQGHTRAMNLLARCYEEGWGVARDPAAAVTWYRRSAEGGYFRAEFNYATLLAAGGRLDEALNWFERACLAATAESRPGMVARLAANPEPQIADLGRLLGAAGAAAS